MNKALARCIGGVVPPICTPLTSDQELDVESLLSLRAHLLRGGVSGIFALGSTGEAAYLTDAMSRQVVEILSKHKGDETLLVGVVARTAPRVVEAMQHLLTDAVDGIVITGPFYAAASNAEIAAHFEYIAARSPVPILAYNIPPNVGYGLPTAVVAGLLDRGVIAGIKDSSADLAGLRDIVASTPPGAQRLYFTGSDGLLDCALHVGANGAVAGLANVVPDRFVEAVSAHRTGDMAAVTRAQAAISHLTRLYVPTDADSGTNSTQLGSIKTALRLLGVIADDAVSVPMRRSSAVRVEFVRAVLREAGLLRVVDNADRRALRGKVPTT
jgi:4-hydroxy-tetrahydrodipicolinate synthase